MSQSEDSGAGAPVVSGVPSTLDKVRKHLGGSQLPPGPPPPPDEEDSDDDGMLRMSFMEHLEELRSRILRSLMGIAVAAVASLSFSSQLWNFVRQPAAESLRTLGYKEDLVAITPMEQFNVIWFKLPSCALYSWHPPGSCFRFGGSFRRVCTAARGAGPFLLS